MEFITTSVTYISVVKSIGALKAPRSLMALAKTLALVIQSAN